MFNQKHEKYGRTIAISLYVYWLILVAWQNLSEYIPNSSIAVLIKAALMIFLAVVFLGKNAAFTVKNLLFWFIFTVFMIFNFIFTGQGLSFANIIFYLFPVAFVAFAFVFQAHAQITKKDLLLFLHLVIATVAYMAVYSILFRTSNFTNIFSISQAYSNELSSFLLSSHEYGMYLTFAITAVIICYQQSKNQLSRILYMVLLALFAVNLIASFSRTSFLASSIILGIFVVKSGKSNIKRWILAVLVLAVVAIIFVPQLRDFAYRILLKENTDAGRFDMWEDAVKQFADSSLMHQFFGQGSDAVEKYLSVSFEHSSIHNAYLQNLLIFGVAGIVFTVCMQISGIRTACRAFRHDRDIATIFLSLAIATFAFMLTNTACIMQSPIDSYMLTVFSLIIPKYVCNAMDNGTFDPETSIEGCE